MNRPTFRLRGGEGSRPRECKPRLLQVSRLPDRVPVETIDSLALPLGVQERIIVECDLPKERPVARTPNPCVSTLIAAETTTEGVLSLAIGVFVRSLNRLLQA